MFFDWGNIQAWEAGYKEVPEFKNYHVSSQGKVDEFRKKALELMDEGKNVVIGYESLAIGGSEGYVTMMVKDGDS